ncbi:MAG: DUF4367 domain-containing protein [Lachnospiraceae bacterium]
MKKPLVEITEEEIENEAKKIEEEVNAQPVLKNIHAPKELRDAVKKDIAVYEHLSENGKKAMRMGYQAMGNVETQESHPRVKRSKGKPKKRMYLLVAVVAIMMMAMGITSVGGPKHFTKMFEQMFEGRSRVKINSKDEKIIPTDTDAQEKAYQQVKDELGFDMPRLFYLPDGTKFKQVMISRKSQKATITYLYQKRVISYRAVASYEDRVFGKDIEDKWEKKYTIVVQDVTATINQYQIQETGEAEFTAQFQHNGIQYFLMGMMKQQEFDKMVKKLKFV